jgi:hypothetical protein
VSEASLKFTVETDRLKRFLSTVLIGKSAGKPMLDHVTVTFTPEGAMVRDASIATIGVFAVFSKKYFLEYECTGKIDVPLTTSLYEMAKKFSGEQVSLALREGTITLSSKGPAGGDEYTEHMLEAGEVAWPESLKMAMAEEYITPEKPEMALLVKLPVSQLELPMDTDAYRFSLEGDSLNVTAEDVGMFRRRLTPIKTVKSASVSVSVDTELLDAALNNLDGDIWLGIHNDLIALSKRSKDHAVCYLIATKYEEVETAEAEK